MGPISLMILRTRFVVTTAVFVVFDSSSVRASRGR